MTANGTKKTNGGTVRRSYKIIGIVVLVVVVGALVVWLRTVRAGEDPALGVETCVVERGPLTISVLEAGAMRAKDPEIIRNEVEGRQTAITFLIPEGTRVKKDDLLVELDVSTLTDTKIDREIAVKSAEALYINARETMTITTSQAQSDVNLAQLKLEFAKQDLDKYERGQYPNDRKAAEGKIRLNEEELTRAKETLNWSQRLSDEKYLSLTQLQADQLAHSKAQVNLEVAKNDANLLREYTYHRQMTQLTSDVNQAGMALERARAKARADIAKAQADLEAREQEYNRQKTKLDKINDQLKKSKIRAPVDGMVVYATSARPGGFHDDRRPLMEGGTVFERQELIYLPRSNSIVADVAVHEASLDKVHAGLPAIVKVDALPGKEFVGTVARIAPLPDPQNMWGNPDLKVYRTDVALESDDPALRSGMSCKVEIIVEQYEDAVYVPVEAVLRVGGKPTVYVAADGEVKAREIEIGLDNNKVVKVNKGLSGGEVVLKTPPLRAAALSPASKFPGTGADGNDATVRQIVERLRAADKMGAVEPAGGSPRSKSSAPGEAGKDRPRLGTEGFPAPTPEQAEQMRKRFENMTPEQRQEMEKMRERFQNMTPEEREQLRQKFRGSGGPGAGRRGGQGQDDSQSPGGGRDNDDQRRGQNPGPGAERTQ